MSTFLGELHPQEQASEALGAPYAAIGAHVRAADVVHTDETRHPRGGVRERASTWWMWVAPIGVASLFGMHAKSTDDTP